MLTYFSSMLKFARDQKAARIDAAERKAIAKAFNDRYTYRKEWIAGKDQLPGTAMYGWNPRGGYAWMCPECNKIHHPVESSMFSGLQYPKCCSAWLGHRLDLGIRVK